MKNLFLLFLCCTHLLLACSTSRAEATSFHAAGPAGQAAPQAAAKNPPDSIFERRAHSVRVADPHEDDTGTRGEPASGFIFSSLDVPAEDLGQPPAQKPVKKRKPAGKKIASQEALLQQFRDSLLSESDGVTLEDLGEMHRQFTDRQREEARVLQQRVQAAQSAFDGQVPGQAGLASAESVRLALEMREVILENNAVSRRQAAEREIMQARVDQYVAFQAARIYDVYWYRQAQVVVTGAAGCLAILTVGCYGLQRILRLGRLP